MATAPARKPNTRPYTSINRNTEHRLVYGYCRVSTDMQAQHGLSLDAQQAEITRYAAERGWKVAEIFVDGGYSGKDTERPAYQRMAKAIKLGDGKITAVVVTKLDRLTRSLRDMLAIYEDVLQPYDCDFVAIRDGINTSDGMGKMIMPFLAIMGQIERQNTSERVRAVRKHITDQGGHYGKIPFGFVSVRDGKMMRLIECPTTHSWRQKIIEWYRDGVPMAQIAKRLNEAGIKPKYATLCDEWTMNKVYELLIRIGVHKTRSIDSTHTFDRSTALEIAYAGREAGKTFAQVAATLNDAKLRPLKAGKYSLSAVLDLLRSAGFHDRATARGYALYLKEQGHSLREIGTRLAQAGHRPKRGGQWYAVTVRMLMVS